MAAPSKKNNRVDVITQGTGSIVQRGDVLRKDIEVHQTSNEQQEEAAPAASVSDLEAKLSAAAERQAKKDLTKAVQQTREPQEKQDPPAEKPEPTRTTASADEKEEETPLTEEQKKERGFAKASPRFQKLDEKAEASQQDKEKSLEDNKVGEVDLSEVQNDGGE